jgi:hypothetical protein
MRKRRLPIPQHEFGFAADSFNLFQETALDGDRIARELAALAKARELADRAQTALFQTTEPQTINH